MTTWSKVIENRLYDIDRERRWRSPVSFDALGPLGTLGPLPVGELDREQPSLTNKVVSFASNDYLGLSTHPAVCKAAKEAIDRWGSGARGSRLLTGSRPIHHDLEQELAQWKKTEATVLFPTGYSANLGIMAVLGELGATIYSDELNHASIIDGCRLSKSTVSIYRHNDIAQLDSMLSKNRTAGSADVESAFESKNKPLPVIVSDVVFSMDGDTAYLDELAELSRRYGALLVLDEAHNVFDIEIDEEIGRDLTLVRVGTLSKMFGATGGYIASSKSVVTLLENTARPYIFSTALAPSSAAAALTALDIYRSTEGMQLRDTLMSYIERIRPGHKSPIIPVILGSESDALGASKKLLEQGMWVPAIRPPSVPVGTSRLRVTLSSSHTPDQIDILIQAIESLSSSARRLEPTPEPSDHISSHIPISTQGSYATRLNENKDSRPSSVILVTGVGTEVGKTWVTSHLLEGLRRENFLVAARKPVQSYEPLDDPSQLDSAVLAQASGELTTAVCPKYRSYPLPMAPPMASEMLGLSPFMVGDLVAELGWPSPVVDFGVVEIAGGVHSPQACDGDGVELAKLLIPDVTLLVAGSGLGCINAVRSSMAALSPVVSAHSIIVVLNCFEFESPLHLANARWLREKDHMEVVTISSSDTELSNLIDRIKLILAQQNMAQTSLMNVGGKRLF